MTNTSDIATHELVDESGWLVEEEAGGIIHWIALANFVWPLTKFSNTRGRRDYDAERYMSPVQRVKDSNDALRFARKQDAEAFIVMFDRFLLLPKATEHCWPQPAILTTHEALTEAREALAIAVEAQRKAMLRLRAASGGKFDAKQDNAWLHLWGVTGDVQRAAKALTGTGKDG